MLLTDGLYWYREHSPFGDCNTYLFEDEFLVMFDPGNPRYLEDRLKEIERDELNPHEIKIIANTHCHPDHSGANSAFQKITGAEIQAASAEMEYVEKYRSTGIFGKDYESFDAKLLGEVIQAGRTTIEVLDTPGHSPGSVCFHCPAKKFLITGDLAFYGGIGRTDLPGGSLTKLQRSLESISKRKTSLFLPGHGDIIEGWDRIRDNFEVIKNRLPWFVVE